MNPIIQIELWQLVTLCAVCLAFGFCFGVVIMSLAAVARSDGINQPPTTPKPDITVKPQTYLREGPTKSTSKEPPNTPRPTNPPPSQGRPQRASSDAVALVDFRLGLAFVLHEYESIRNRGPVMTSGRAIDNFNLVINEARNVLGADEDRLREAMVEAGRWLDEQA